MTVKQILSGHYNEATAHMVEDYPYGFRLRCKIRYWLEVNDKGTRFWSQTTNPKRGDVWNKAKVSTYAVVGAMYLDENDHVQWEGFSPYNMEKVREWLKIYEAGLSSVEKLLINRLADAYDRRQQAKAATVEGTKFSGDES